MRAAPLRLGADPRAPAARLRRVRHAAAARVRPWREDAHPPVGAPQEATPHPCRHRSKRPSHRSAFREEREIVAEMMPYGSSWEEELSLLFQALPPRIASAAQRLSAGRGDLLEIVVSGQSILLLGPPGIGKTTMLRECARVLSDEMGKRVVIVDTSNEIAGDGDIPHPGIGRARRMQVRTPALQHAVMIEAVENH